MNKRNEPVQEVNDYYDLKTDEVNQLAKVMKQPPAGAGEQRKVISKTQNPYKVDRLAKIPAWIKSLFIKFWFAGAMCYFGFWGLGIYLADDLDKVFVVGLITGCIADLLVNPAFLYFESDKKEYHKYMMIPVSGRKLWTLFVNIAYGIMVTFAVYVIYSTVNYALVMVKHLPEGTVLLPVEPLGYGLFFLMVDMFFITFKNIIVGHAKIQ